MTNQVSYPIYIGEKLLHNAQLFTNHSAGKQILCVSNETVAPLYLDKIADHFSDYQFESLVLADGEEHKNMDFLMQIFDYLIEKNFRRNATLVALGGGVIGDMAGFAAACYQRGVDFIQVPTSLLAQVDASVGGKTAVNHPLGKNMIGAFYQPQCVVIDLNCLKTLPPREFRAGLAEVIKYALIYDKQLFDYLDHNLDALLRLDSQALHHIITRCCEIKAAVVAQDERETGIRAILNFGHTLGHAVETGLGYGEWLHGEAVALGMLVAAELSQHYGKISQTEVVKLDKLLERADLPRKAPSDFSLEKCKAIMGRDKKNIDQNLRFVLLSALGEAEVVQGIDNKVLDSILLQYGFV